MGTVVLLYRRGPSTWRGRRRARKSKFDRALSLIQASLPREARVEILKQFQEAISEIIQVEEGAKVSPSMGRRRTNKPAVSPIPDNKADQRNAEFMATLRQQADDGLIDDIRNGRLLASADIVDRMRCSKQALSAAVKNRRMFALPGPSGENYCPAFFGDVKYDRRSLEQVSKALGTLPGGRNWYFFTMPRTSLGGQTPLAALAKGKLDDVLAAAKAFVEE